VCGELLISAKISNSPHTGRTLIGDRAELAIRCGLNRVGESTDIKRLGPQLGPFATRVHKRIPSQAIFSVHRSRCGVLRETIGSPS
jgi:hypothetical protein